MQHKCGNRTTGRGCEAGNEKRAYKWHHWVQQSEKEKCEQLRVHASIVSPWERTVADYSRDEHVNGDENKMKQ
jgi:hypothetical protein